MLEQTIGVPAAVASFQQSECPRPRKKLQHDLTHVFYYRNGIRQRRKQQAIKTQSDQPIFPKM